MAVGKETFAAETFRSDTFSSGSWVGLSGLSVDIGTSWRVERASLVARQKLRKTIDDDRLYEMDFADQLDTGELVSGFPTVTAEPATLTIADENSINTKSQARISAGDDKENYLVRFQQPTSAGNILEAIGRLFVRD